MAEHAIQPLTSEEIALVERARRRDPDAIRLIVKQQNQKRYRIARSILRDDSEAEDVLQEAYARAFAGLDVFRGRRPVWHLARADRHQRGARAASSTAARQSTSSAHQGRPPPRAARSSRSPTPTLQLDPETVHGSRLKSAPCLNARSTLLPQAFRNRPGRPPDRGHERRGDGSHCSTSLPETVKTRLHRARSTAEARNGEACRPDARRRLSVCRAPLRAASPPW